MSEQSNIEPTPESATPAKSEKKQALKKFAKKAGPYVFWGAVISLPAMNLGAAVLNFKAAELAHATELLKEAAETTTDIATEL
jgi:hypothetical protein